MKSDLGTVLGHEPDWDLIFQKMDTDADGYVDYNDFIASVYDPKELLSKKNLQAAFDCLDLNNDGSVGLEELKNCFLGENRASSVSIGIEKANIAEEEL